MRPMSSAGTRYLEVRLVRLSLHRGGRTVLKGISWTIRPGERWVLAGANGAGKTQLLKLVAGIVWPKAAARATRQYLLGRQLSSTPVGIKDEIAYLGAERALPPHWPPAVGARHAPLGGCAAGGHPRAAAPPRTHRVPREAQSRAAQSLARCATARVAGAGCAP